ncbi:biotin--[acetyl-CoA-carboxylase] ligase [Methyloversatilis sp. MC4-4]|uniref:biotin--[acetyl-CoA-carboxylase] ligase n=1 Tax=Methyloversatilis sp. MC4-4 TaxID=3132824 RepID=UPI003CF80511
MIADDASTLAEALRDRAPSVPADWRVDVCARTESTNSDLLERRDGVPCALFALAQTGGRGRRGRSWTALPGDSLTFSLRVRFDGRADRLSGLSLAVGVALAEALTAQGFDGLALKWPNDLMRATGQGAGKLGGVLIELASTPTHTDAVIGVGINLAPPPSGHYALPTAALFDGTPPQPDWLRIAAAALDALAAALPVFAAQGFSAFAERWNRLNLHAGCAVEVEGEMRALGGLCVGADADGALLLDCGDRIERVLAGDVSLRAPVRN